MAAPILVKLVPSLCQKNYLLKTQQLILGIGNAIEWVNEPHWVQDHTENGQIVYQASLFDIVSHLH